MKLADIVKNNLDSFEKDNKNILDGLYTGITKQKLNTRLKQHNSPSRGNKGLTRNQARAVETRYIKDFRGMNKILSISERNKFSKLAEKWAKNFFGG